MNTDRSKISTKLTLRIPQELHCEPIIASLVSRFWVVVNITAAILGETNSEGWFNLELLGTQSQVDSSLIYLEELNLEFWQRNQADEDGHSF